MRKQISTSYVCLIGLALAVGASGCGSAKDDQANAKQRSPVAASPPSATTAESNGPSTGHTTRLSIGMRRVHDLYDKKTLRARAGKVVITFANSGRAPHNIAIKGNGVFAATSNITTGRISLTSVLKPGRYTFFCSFSRHEQAGMRGTLTVT